MSQDALRLPAGLAAGFTMRNGNTLEFAEGIFPVAASRAKLGGQAPFSKEPFLRCPIFFKIAYLWWIICDVAMLKT